MLPRSRMFAWQETNVSLPSVHQHLTRCRYTITRIPHIDFIFWDDQIDRCTTKNPSNIWRDILFSVWNLDAIILGIYNGLNFFIMHSAMW